MMWNMRQDNRAFAHATRYGLDGQGIESRWGLDFPHPSTPLPLPPSLMHIGYRLFPGSKAAGAWRPLTPSSAEVKWRVELDICSPSGPSWPVLVWPLTFTFLWTASYWLATDAVANWGLKRYGQPVNHLTPNGHYMGRTAQLTSRCCILYIYSTNIRTEYFKHAA